MPEAPQLAIETPNLDLAMWKQRETVTIPEAAKIIGISRNVAYAAAKDGTLPVLHFGSRLVVAVPALLRLLGYEEA